MARQMRFVRLLACVVGVALLAGCPGGGGGSSGGSSGASTVDTTGTLPPGSSVGTSTGTDSSVPDDVALNLDENLGSDPISSGEGGAPVHCPEPATMLLFATAAGAAVAKFARRRS